MHKSRMAAPPKLVECHIHNKQFWANGDAYRRGGHWCDECKDEEARMSVACRELQAEGVKHPRVDQCLQRAEAKAGKTFKRYAKRG